MANQEEGASAPSQVVRLSGRKLLLAGNYNAVRRPYNGVVYEFLNTIAAVEDATVLAPQGRHFLEPAFRELAAEYATLHIEMMTRLRHAVGLPAMARTCTTALTEDVDLCFFMCQFPRDLSEIERIRHWRERSAKACLFILETWPHALVKHRAELRILDKFDHIFVLNPATIAALAHHTSTPVSFLPTATDCLSCGDPREAVARSIDILSLGRRDKQVHAILRDHAASRGSFYYYDAWSMHARDWSEARRMSAELIRRAKYYLAWDPAPLIGRKLDAVATQTGLSTRYFEGAAGGAILVGTRPAVPEFDTLFDWPDAVVEVSSDPRSIIEVITMLEADPARRQAISMANRTQSLLRHDWAYRWDAVLKTMGLERTVQLDRRIAQLQAAAAETARPASDGRRDRAKRGARLAAARVPAASAAAAALTAATIVGLGEATTG
jgi:hypothetical protein